MMLHAFALRALAPVAPAAAATAAAAAPARLAILAKRLASLLAVVLLGLLAVVLLGLLAVVLLGLLDLRCRFTAFRGFHGRVVSSFGRRVLAIAPFPVAPAASAATAAPAPATLAGRALGTLETFGFHGLLRFGGLFPGLLRHDFFLVDFFLILRLGLV
jgi:hypothetical protein